MKQIRSLLLLLILAMAPTFALASNAEGEEDGKTINIPETVLEHLSDSYEWHIASYEGKSLSIPLPIIVRSSNTGEWTFCTEASLPDNFYFDAKHMVRYMRRWLMVQQFVH